MAVVLFPTPPLLLMKLTTLHTELILHAMAQELLYLVEHFKFRMLVTKSHLLMLVDGESFTGSIV